MDKTTTDIEAVRARVAALPNIAQFAAKYELALRTLERIAASAKLGAPPKAREYAPCSASLRAIASAFAHEDKLAMRRARAAAKKAGQ